MFVLIFVHCVNNEKNNDEKNNIAYIYVVGPHQKRNCL